MIHSITADLPFGANINIKPHEEAQLQRSSTGKPIEGCSTPDGHVAQNIPPTGTVSGPPGATKLDRGPSRKLLAMPGLQSRINVGSRSGR